MGHAVLLHAKVRKTLGGLPEAERGRIEAALRKLADDPFTPRSGADIKRLKGTHGRQDLFRLRVGDWRAVYAVEGDEVLVTDLFRRGQGYEV